MEPSTALMLPNPTQHLHIFADRRKKSISFCTAREHNACIIPVTTSPYGIDTLCEKSSCEIKRLQRSWDAQLGWQLSVTWLWAAAFIPKFCATLPDLYIQAIMGKGLRNTQLLECKFTTVFNTSSKHLTNYIKTCFWPPAMLKTLPQIKTPAVLCVLLMPQTTTSQLCTAQKHLLTWRFP